MARDFQIWANVDLLTKASQIPLIDSWQAAVFALIATYLYVQKRRGESRIVLDELEHKHMLDDKLTVSELQTKHSDVLQAKNVALQDRLDQLTSASVADLSRQKAELEAQRNALNSELLRTLQDKLRVEAENLVKGERIAMLEAQVSRLRVARDHYRGLSQDAAQELYMRGLRDESEALFVEISEADEAVSQVNKISASGTHLDAPIVVRLVEDDEDDA